MRARHGGGILRLGNSGPRTRNEEKAALHTLMPTVKGFDLGVTPEGALSVNQIGFVSQKWPKQLYKY
jgi:hypothetical protein